MNFSEKLTRLVRSSKMTQKAIVSAMNAKGVKLTEASFSRWMQGTNRPEDENKIRILAEVLKVDPYELTGSAYLNKIPLLSWVQAGVWNETFTDYAEYIEVPVMVKSHCFALQVRGNSMSKSTGKSYFDGCYVIVDPYCEKTPESLLHKIVIARKQGEATIKEFILEGNKPYLKPWNPDYPILEVTSDTEIIGVVIRMFD